MGIYDIIKNSLDEHAKTFNQFLEGDTVKGIESIAKQCQSSLELGGKILICGNGGSHCQALHFAEELTGRFRNDRPPIACMALGANVGHVTCTANDYGFEDIFKREIEAFIQPVDTLICLSTSGNSINVFMAADAAIRKDACVVGLLGKDGGTIKGKCHHAIIADGETSDRIQEIHLVILHILVECIEGLSGHSEIDGMAVNVKSQEFLKAIRQIGNTSQ